MEINKLSYSEAKRIPITDYLSGLGFEPAKVRGVDHWYHSPFREERTPSFKVNTHMNLWYDHGTGEGGSILDLGAKLHQCTLQEFLEKLSQGNHNVSLHRQPLHIEKPKSKLEVISVKVLADQDLIHYLNSRGIDIEIARKYCKEVEFRIGPKMYCAIGFPNQSGAYELRNRWFKGSSSPKDISFINNEAEKLSVLEGFIDFLSVVQLDHSAFKKLTKDSDFLVLNSLRLLNRSLPILQSHKEVNMFLDNDLAAKEAKDGLQDKGVQFHDASILYRENKDVNEYLGATKEIKPTNEAKQTQEKQKKKSRGLSR
ncbi:MAG TPA: toprim domain-containing protein [Cyclobacteriaceae bacterium]|nr:toprim domain-containing protein [Cyclobacteriaceae bacterium]